ncbi:hypothetical protein [Tessaracoccus coleopterorum]|uniref:hypothetical protein n=1 Tax=Tessaracoccus coleopterorum TaxID=2714950 RepID=UPI001E5C20D1|nr:hypothetical protein [Tessaracoccus coleopterorum]
MVTTMDTLDGSSPHIRAVVVPASINSVSSSRSGSSATARSAMANFCSGTVTWRSRSDASANRSLSTGTAPRAPG